MLKMWIPIKTNITEINRIKVLGKTLLTIHGDCRQKQTWDLFVLCMCHWLNIQISHNMG